MYPSDINVVTFPYYCEEFAMGENENPSVQGAEKVSPNTEPDPKLAVGAFIFFAIVLIGLLVTLAIWGHEI